MFRIESFFSCINYIYSHPFHKMHLQLADFQKKKRKHIYYNIIVNNFLEMIITGRHTCIWYIDCQGHWRQCHYRHENSICLIQSIKGCGGETSEKKLTQVTINAWKNSLVGHPRPVAIYFCPVSSINNFSKITLPIFTKFGTYICVIYYSGTLIKHSNDLLWYILDFIHSSK